MLFRSGKYELWEGGIREPAFVRWTGKIKEGSITTQVATTMDWTATILSLAEAKADPRFPLEGVDMMPVMRGEKKKVDRILYWRIFQSRQQKAMRDGKWKYFQDEKGNEYLFDLDSDPVEKNNLKEKFPELFQQLKNKYSEWEKTVLTPFPS